jgi:ferrous iron transport protein B
LKQKNEHIEQTVYLVGNPNTGKTSLFNQLTGLNQRVGNFPGVTVEKKTGSFTTATGKKINIIDLPGVYSLDSLSADEKLAADYIKQSKNEIILIVTDATNLKRNLVLATQIMDLNKPVVIAVNMMDLLQKANMEIDFTKLSKLLGVPIVPINARIGKGIDELKYALANFKNNKTSFLGKQLEHPLVDEKLLRYNKIDSIIRQTVHIKGENKLALQTLNIDKFVTHKYFGFLIFLLVMFMIFQAIFSWSAYPMDWIENLFLQLSQNLQTILPAGTFTDLLTEGVIPGISGVAVFIPQIALLFFFITLLEDSGYLARVSYIMDRILRPFGLNGKSVIPMLSSTACAVPSIMGTRIISNKKERLITILVLPLISCSARIPVYTLLIAFAIPAEMTLGPFNMQGIVLMSLYMISFISALLVSYVLKFIVKTNEKSRFVIEMPIYRIPRLKSVLLTMYQKVKIFMVDAGKIILAISIVLWALSSYGPSSKMKEIEEKYQSSEIINKYTEDEISQLKQTEKLENSFAGILGKTIEPIIRPLGYDWKIGIALISSFAAREVFVGTMSTLYSIEGENEVKLLEKLRQAKNPQTGKPVYTFAVAISLLLFYVFAMQCMATLAIVKKETESWKWPIVQFLYMGILAYSTAFMAYHFLS